jgi:hypothetical protein
VDLHCFAIGGINILSAKKCTYGKYEKLKMLGCVWIVLWKMQEPTRVMDDFIHFNPWSFFLNGNLKIKHFYLTERNY